MGLTHKVTEGVSIIEFEYEGISEKHITVTAMDGESLDCIIEKLDNAVGKSQIVFQIAFGACEIFTSHPNLMTNGRGHKPRIAWVSGETEKNPVSGIYAFALNGCPVTTLYDEEEIIGYKYNDRFSEYIYLSGIFSTDSNAYEEEQAKSCFDKTKKILLKNDMNIKNLVRTWFYNNDILKWYKQFNNVRTKFYTGNGIIGSIIPASTCIGGANPHNKALIMGLIALKPLNPSLVQIKEVESPLQDTARTYGSMFSRAVEVSTSCFKKLYISGTAAINKDGSSIHTESIQDQIKYSFDVVKNILITNGMAFSDVTRAFAYFREKEHIKYFNEYMNSNGIINSQVITTNNTICREDLLFEIELDAIQISS